MKLLHLQAHELAPYAEGLRALEGTIRYPVGDGEDHFTIDHGQDYHPFFSEMGEAHFMVGVDEDEVFASLAGVFRTARLGQRQIPTAYLGDFKLAPSHRGRGLGRRIGMRCLGLLWDKPELRRWHIAYGAAMRGDRGDVTRTLKGLHPGRLMRPLAEQALYFEPPARLRNLGDGPPAPSIDGLDLGGNQTPGPLFVSTEGRKNLRLESTGKHWPLMHLPRAPQHWSHGLGAMLTEAGQTLPDDTVACFAVDRRLEDHIQWLHTEGIEAGATCTLYALTRPRTLPKALPWVHLATSEI